MSLVKCATCYENIRSELVRSPLLRGVDRQPLADGAHCFRCRAKRADPAPPRKWGPRKSFARQPCKEETKAKISAARMQHGEARRAGHSAEYKSWRSMKARCLTPSCPGWDRYGGRGISVCTRWMSFENFLADMGRKPPGTSLDRINNDGNYEPGNCRWATDLEQANNTRSNIRIEIDGIAKTLSQWCREIGVVGVGTAWDRIKRKGWPGPDAVTTPPGGRRP